MTEPPLLEVEHLGVEFRTSRGALRAVRDVGFGIHPGEVMGLVGESGSGKSVTASAILGLVRSPGEIVSGTFAWSGHTVESRDHLKNLRGSRISIIPQEPVRSLNPLGKIGKQISEVLSYHRPDLSRGKVDREVIELLDAVGIAAPERRTQQYPHELSGGMCQRVLIALALASEPELLIADEPTTSLDVTIQAQIIELLNDLCRSRGLAVIFITHDLSLVGQFCDTVVVMYCGRVVERGPREIVFNEPRHPYTAALLRSTPKLEGESTRLPAIPGVPPDPLLPPDGCPFHPRCALVEPRCRVELPPLDPVGGREQLSACWESHRVS